MYIVIYTSIYRLFSLSLSLYILSKVEGLRKKICLFQVLEFVSKMDFGVFMCALVAVVGVKR